MIHLRTPLLVYTELDRDIYLGQLSKPAKKNWAAARKRNAGRTFKEVPYDPTLTREFMELWTRQRVNGGHPRWIFGPEYFDRMASRNWLRLFVLEEHGAPIALHPVEHFGNFTYTQPVLYDKGEDPGAAKFMWFNLMFWACDQVDVRWVDLGGGFHGSWNQFLRNRSDPGFSYKWQFVAKEVKDDPQRQPHYFAQRCSCGYKQLVVAPCPCPGCTDSGTS